eukprot:TRINITY_DN9232_c0_g1_i1.p1 TRINITY_DN9232_c0_g1~~TRINITY_DN9232_c0_g1_i1.p1  ORF type:complete len:335 (+),score=88.53 TRINITY_DN9232_c0_g1_i1:50-1054(+)
MPKPNGYFFYMQEMRKQRSDWSNKGNGELSQLCSAGWNSLTPEEKKVYNDMKHNSDIRVPKPGRKAATPKGETDLGGVDSLGRSLREIHFNNQKAEDKKFSEFKEMESLVESMLKQSKAQIFVINTTNYCIAADMDPKIYLPAEISVTKYDVLKGSFEEKFNVFCKPIIPLGFTLMVKEASENKLKVPFPEFEKALHYEEVATSISTFIAKNKGLKEMRKMTVFTHPKERETCIQNLAAVFGCPKDIPFRVMSLADIVAAFNNAKDDLRVTPATMADVLDHKKGGDEEGTYCNYHLVAQEDGDAYMPLCSTEVATKWIKYATQLLNPLYIKSRK